MTRKVYTDNGNMRRCSRCGRRFKSRAGADQHIAQVHKGKGERVTVDRFDDDSEPSMASLVIEADMDRAMGLPVDDWLADILDDQA